MANDAKAIKQYCLGGLTEDEFWELVKYVSLSRDGTLTIKVRFGARRYARELEQDVS